ncbi:MAG: PAS domain S-box protein [bacterium]
MKVQHKIMSLAIIIGLCIWFFDAVLDFFFFHEGTFFEVLVFGLHPHHLYIRLVGLVSFAVCGFFISKAFVMRKRIEESLREYQKAVESSHDLMAAVDRNYRYRFVNEAFLAYHAMSWDQVIGHTAAEILGQEMFEKTVKPKLDRCLQGESVDYDLGCQYAGLKKRYFHVAYYPLKANSDEIIGAVSVMQDVTERKKTEEALKMKDSAIASSTNAVAFADLEGRIIYVNDAFLKMWRYDGESEVLGKPAITFWQEEEKALSILKAVRDHKKSWKGEVAAIRKNGSIFTAQVSAHMVEDDAGGPICMMASFIDITEVRRTEEELARYRLHLEEMVEDRTRELMIVNKQLGEEISERKEIERVLRIKDSALASSINAFGLADLEGKIFYVNSSFLKMWGYDDSREVLGKSVIQFGYRENRVKEIIEAVRNFGNWRGEDLARKKDGSPFETQVWVNMVTNEAGSPMCLMATFIDITEQKRAEGALRESEAKYSVVVEQAHDGISIVQDGINIFANKALAEMTGYAREELIGIPFLDFVAPEYRSMVAQRVTLGMDGAEVRTPYEVKIQGRDGIIRDVEVSAGIIHYQGKPALVLIMRDITERKKIQEELQKEERLEALGILAGGIAHDFNNLLAAILGNVSLAEVYVGGGNEAAQILSEAKMGCRKATGLAQQLLTFSKGGAPVRKPCSIGELLEDTANFTLRGSEVGCTFSLADDLWPVEIDEGQISQVISNLVMNAHQAMPGGGIIEIRAENAVVGPEDELPLERGSYIKISVRDQGIGIPEKYLGHIFDPYFTTKQDGSGLGLAICFSIISRHGGYLAVASKLGVGTTFTIYLPASGKEIFTVEGIEEEKLYVGEGRILLMDDQKQIRDMVSRMLNHLGYEAACAGNGAEAIELYKKAKEAGSPFDIVILDLTVPGGVGGQEAIEKIHEIDPGAKAIISSGYSNHPIISKYVEYGFSGVVAKPYEMKELSKILHRVMAGRS